MRLDKIMKAWKKEAGYDRVVQYKYDRLNHKLHIFMAHPGYFIGRQGRLVEKYKKILDDNCYHIYEVSFTQTEYNCA